MKISEESKKFIADIARLNDKLEELKGVLGGLTKEEEMLKGQYAAAERRRMELSKEKNCYEIEQKNIIGKNEALKL